MELPRPPYPACVTSGSNHGPVPKCICFFWQPRGVCKSCWAARYNSLERASKILQAVHFTRYVIDNTPATGDIGNLVQSVEYESNRQLSFATA